MTREEWLDVRVGDQLVDLKAKGTPRRRVLSVKRVQPRNSRHQRTSLTVPSLKTAGETTIVWSTEDTLGLSHGIGSRFVLVSREP